jgi:hypothetical protein
MQSAELHLVVGLEMKRKLSLNVRDYHSRRGAYIPPNIF